MKLVSAAVCVISLCVLDQALSRSTTRCSTVQPYGGFCMNKWQDCPAGTYEFDLYSNYIGCFRLDQKCCAATSSGNTIQNPDGGVWRPPVQNPDGVWRPPVQNPDGVWRPPVQSRTCGIGSLQPASRILDGTRTGVCDWPFVVSIRALLRNSNTLSYTTSSHACQGVLIDPQWVLTSPFCIFSAAPTIQDAPSRILVIAGEYNVSGIDIDPVTRQPQEQVINVDSVYIHPNYPYRTQEELLPFDDAVALNSDAVALIRLREPINGRCSGIICLPTAAEAANNCAAYDECVITGWGFSTESFNPAFVRDELLLGRTRLSSGEACDFLTGRLGLEDSRPRGSICQSPQNRNTDSCLGDEGGAVMCSNGNNWVVRGILPFNICLEGRYQLYVTDVAPYLQWIQSTMSRLG